MEDVKSLNSENSPTHSLALPWADRNPHLTNLPEQRAEIREDRPLLTWKKVNRHEEVRNLFLRDPDQAVQEKILVIGVGGASNGEENIGEITRFLPKLKVTN